MPEQQLTMEEEHLAVLLVARDVRNGSISREAVHAALTSENRENFLRSHLEIVYAQAA